MANAAGGQPIKLDTAVANHAALLLPNNLPLYVNKVEWFNPTAAGDTFTIRDTDGLVLLTGIAEAATATPGNSQIYNFIPPAIWTKPQGWYLSQISSGSLYIYFR